MCYTFVWTQSKKFIALCKSWPLIELGAPIDVIVAVFFVNKILQVSAPVLWYLETAPPPSFESITMYQYATAGELFPTVRPTALMK
jgi:hypothetical protein